VLFLIIFCILFYLHYHVIFVFKKMFLFLWSPQIIYMIGWSPDSSQPKPCKRGSAKVSMKDIGAPHVTHTSNSSNNRAADPSSGGSKDI
jgi:hypothetical protein